MTTLLSLNQDFNAFSLVIPNILKHKILVSAVEKAERAASAKKLKHERLRNSTTNSKNTDDKEEEIGEDDEEESLEKPCLDNKDLENNSLGGKRPERKKILNKYLYNNDMLSNLSLPLLQSDFEHAQKHKTVKPTFDIPKRQVAKTKKKLYKCQREDMPFVSISLHRRQMQRLLSTSDKSVESNIHAIVKRERQLLPLYLPEDTQLFPISLDRYRIMKPQLRKKTRNPQPPSRKKSSSQSQIRKKTHFKHTKSNNKTGNVRIAFPLNKPSGEAHKVQMLSEEAPKNQMLSEEAPKSQMNVFDVTQMSDVSQMSIFDVSKVPLSFTGRERKPTAKLRDNDFEIEFKSGWNNRNRFREKIPRKMKPDETQAQSNQEECLVTDIKHELDTIPTENPYPASIVTDMPNLSPKHIASNVSEINSEKPFPTKMPSLSPQSNSVYKKISSWGYDQPFTPLNRVRPAFPILPKECGIPSMHTPSRTSTAPNKPCFTKYTATPPASVVNTLSQQGLAATVSALAKEQNTKKFFQLTVGGKIVLIPSGTNGLIPKAFVIDIPSTSALTKPLSTPIASPSTSSNTNNVKFTPNLSTTNYFSPPAPKTGLQTLPNTLPNTTMFNTQMPLLTFNTQPVSNVVGMSQVGTNQKTQGLTSSVATQQVHGQRLLESNPSRTSSVVNVTPSMNETLSKDTNLRRILSSSEKPSLKATAQQLRNIVDKSPGSGFRPTNNDSVAQKNVNEKMVLPSAELAWEIKATVQDKTSSFWQSVADTLSVNSFGTTGGCGASTGMRNLNMKPQNTSHVPSVAVHLPVSDSITSPSNVLPVAHPSHINVLPVGHSSIHSSNPIQNVSLNLQPNSASDALVNLSSLVTLSHSLTQANQIHQVSIGKDIKTTSMPSVQPGASLDGTPRVNLQYLGALKTATGVEKPKLVLGQTHEHKNTLADSTKDQQVGLSKHAIKKKTNLEKAKQLVKKRIWQLVRNINVKKEKVYLFVRYLIVEELFYVVDVGGQFEFHKKQT